MPKLAHVEIPFHAIARSLEKPHSGQLVSVLLFSGIGLLISLVAVISGVQGAWF